MSTADKFGLKSEGKIKASKVREIFTPSRPINSILLFHGRETQVGKIIQFINTPGQHALLYGDRGVGKSSLANIVTAALSPHYFPKEKVFKKRCDSKTTFYSIVQTPLKALGLEPSLTELASSEKLSGKAGAKIIGIGAGVGAEREVSKKFKPEDLTPSRVAELLNDVEALFLIDEIDGVKDDDVRHSLAELVKQLSDADSKFKMLLVGIGETTKQLTGGHASVQRCLKGVKLERMPIDELRLIITDGAKKLSINFSDDVTAKIIKISAGYPHFTHLLALKSAELVISNDDVIVQTDHLRRALIYAVADAEQALRDQYDKAVRGKHKELYCAILTAGAALDRLEFSSDVLMREVNKRMEPPMKKAALYSFLQRLVSDTEETILRRKFQGIYRFNDPRMPSFVKMVSNHIDS